jgi:hydroxybutyrate-dimer hydrolase
VSEPNVALAANPALTIVAGGSSATGTARPLYDYFTLANLLQPCASQSSRAQGSPGLALVPAALAANRCASLKAKGILTAATTAAQADEALDQLLAYGYLSDSIPLFASLYALATPAITMTYSNTYGRFKVSDNLCSLSFAATDASGKPVPFPAASLAQYFGVGNGVPPSAPVNIVNNDSVGGAVNSVISVSPSTGVADFNIDGALCQRNLWTAGGANAGAVQAGVAGTLRTANLHGRPAIIVHGRSDGLIPVPFSSRPYFGQNQIVEGAASKLAYIEVTNAQHFDAFIDNPALPGYDSRFVPLHYYFVQAMDRVWANLTNRTPLPPAQVVHTLPRGGTPGAAPALTAANVPPFKDAPGDGEKITFGNNTVTIPD